jgi:anti-anti-sigma regulatory factor
VSSRPANRLRSEDAHALTIKTVRDGPICTLILRGDLDLLETGGFLEQGFPEHTALAVDERTERLGLDLAGVLFLDCTGVRALRTATRLAPGGCPVIIGSLGPVPRRIVELLDLDLDNLQELSLGHGLRDGPRDSRTGQQDFVPAEPRAPFLAGTEGCP